MKHSITFIMCIVTICSAASKLFFEQQWNQNFHLRPIESGDTLAIGAVYCDGSAIYIYDRAAGTIVTMNAKASIISTIGLEGIGRDTYGGDDFIARDSTFIFVNTVDKRLEYFSRRSGKHLGTQPLPLDALKSQTKRSWRIIDRIELAGDTVLIGNAHVLFDLASGLKKTLSNGSLFRAPGTARFVLANKGIRWYQTGNYIIDNRNGKKRMIPTSHYVIQGKRIFCLDGKLFAVVASGRGVNIVQIK